MKPLVAGVFLVCSLAAAAALGAAEPEAISFSRQIQPILSENCYACHGPDAEHRKADLRLDAREGALAVIEPGDSGASELFRRISSDDEYERMPPAEANRQLSPEQIALLKRWIDAGAPWGKHWSFEPLVRPEVPQVKPQAPGKIRNPIDAFVQAKLARAGLKPAPEASRETLIRRVTLDLTGLPPTPEEVAAFINDDSPDAYEKVVDRLLHSPAYGERMAWPWLDAARYADSNGYQGDRERTMWPWRDWVIDAFNRNLPYDKFTLWQLAGDLLPNPTFEQRLATGFLRNHMINGEGGRIAEENRVEYVMDMSETTGTVWLGLTFNCCRCHDHKFDPITQRNYYEFFAFFNQTPVTGAGGNPQTPPVLAAPSEPQKRRMEQLQRQIAEVGKKLDQRAAELASGQAEWESRKRAALEGGIWRPLAPAEVKAEHQQLTVLDDRSILAGGPNPKNDTYTVIATSDLKEITGLCLKALRHESLTQNGLARSDSGNFVLTELEVQIQRKGEAEPRPVKIVSAEATFEQGGFKIGGAFDGDPGTGWAVYEGRAIDRPHAAAFRFAKPLAAGPGTKLIFTLRHDSPHVSHNLGRFRLSVTSVAAPKLDGEASALAAALRAPADKRSEEQAELVAKTYRESDEAYRKLAAERERAEKQLDAVRKAIPKVMVMEDMPKPRKSYMLDRGLYNQRGEEVTADVPDSLPPLPDGAPANRLGLARWIVSPDNPLTARVTVNRFWQQVFGVGLVKTPADFGVQGEIPPQMDLLNWLAAEFRDGGWNVKALMRLIVTSHTYRQSSKISSPAAYERDPENRLLAHGPRFRMPYWMIRDQALAASGLLARRVGGEPVNGYQPPGVWEEATFGNKRYKRDHGAALYRRSLYTFWRRIIAPTMFFDNASRQVCTVQISRTNTPLQALYTFNDVTFVEAARALAEAALLRTELSDAERVDFIFRRLLARAAKPEETKILLAGLNRSRDAFAADLGAAKKLLAMGESPRREELSEVEHASWTALCLAVFNLDETLTKE